MFIALGSVPFLFTLALAQDPVHLTYSPPEGSVIQKTWVMGHQLYIDSFFHTVDGKREAIEMLVGLTAERTVIVVDELRSTSAGRPLELRRTYKDLKQVTTLTPLIEGTERTRIEQETPLQGSSVVFTWIEDEGAYGRYYDAVEGEESWLPGLTEDMDFRMLLPVEPVVLDQTWTLQASQLRDLLASAGDLHFQSEKGMDRMLVRTLGSGIGGGLHRLFEGESQGQVQMTLKSLTDDVAVLGLELHNVRFVTDLGKYAETNRLKREEEWGHEETTGRLFMEVVGSGELVWDRREGHARRFELLATESVSVTIKTSIGEGYFKDEMNMSGQLKMVVEFTPGEAVPAPRKR